MTARSTLSASARAALLELRRAHPGYDATDALGPGPGGDYFAVLHPDVPNEPPFIERKLPAADPIYTGNRQDRRRAAALARTHR